MHRDIVLSNDMKFRFKEMLCFLLEEDYHIVTHDGGLNYILTRKKKNRDDPFECEDFTWLELCITVVPQRLGMDFLIVPVGDDKFNIAEYLLDYYNEKKEKFIDEMAYNPFALDGDMYEDVYGG